MSTSLYIVVTDVGFNGTEQKRVFCPSGLPHLPTKASTRIEQRPSDLSSVAFGTLSRLLIIAIYSQRHASILEALGRHDR